MPLAWSAAGTRQEAGSRGEGRANPDHVIVGTGRLTRDQNLTFFFLAPARILSSGSRAEDHPVLGMFPRLSGTKTFLDDDIQQSQRERYPRPRRKCLIDVLVPAFHHGASLVA